MAKPSPKRLTVRYPKTSFYVRTASHVLMMALALMALSILGGEATALALLAALFMVYILVVDVSPLLTNHWLTRSRLVLRQGLLFKAILALRDVVSVEPFDDPKVGVRFSLRSSRLYVTSSSRDGILIRLKSPQRFRWALGKKADEVIINVDEQERFLSEMADRLALFAPVESEGAGPEFRNEGHLALVD